MPEKTRLVTCSFHGTVAASSKKTLVSNKVDLRFKTKRIRAAFAPGANRLLRLYFYLSPDESAPTTEPPTGDNILAQLGPQTYIVGEDCVVDFQHEIDQAVSGVYIKIYADNLDAFPHTIDAQITIEIIPWENEKEE